ncbi:hypothetical protein L1887_17388 [Cichorium endivia]|nr:hypothetical protein L1887_17388 [Cichorium endivia]
MSEATRTLDIIKKVVDELDTQNIKNIERIDKFYDKTNTYLDNIYKDNLSLRATHLVLLQLLTTTLKTLQVLSVVRQKAWRLQRMNPEDLVSMPLKLSHQIEKKAEYKESYLAIKRFHKQLVTEFIGELYKLVGEAQYIDIVDMSMTRGNYDWKMGATNVPKLGLVHRTKITVVLA